MLDLNWGLDKATRIIDFINGVKGVCVGVGVGSKWTASARQLRPATQPQNSSS